MTNAMNIESAISSLPGFLGEVISPDPAFQGDLQIVKVEALCTPETPISDTPGYVVFDVNFTLTSAQGTSYPYWALISVPSSHVTESSGLVSLFTLDPGYELFLSSRLEEIIRERIFLATGKV